MFDIIHAFKCGIQVVRGRLNEAKQSRIIPIKPNDA